MITEYPFILFPSELPEQLCSGLIKMGKSLKMVPANVWKGDHVFQPETRVTQLSWINNSEIDAILSIYMEKANTNAGWLFNILGNDIPQFAEYPEGGKYDWHIDIGVEEPNSLLFRKITVVVNLNTDYEGGELYFRLQNLNIKPKAGDLYIFPSSFTHPHRAMPVKSGIKYSIVTMLDYNEKFHSAKFYSELNK